MQAITLNVKIRVCPTGKLALWNGDLFNILTKVNYISHSDTLLRTVDNLRVIKVLDSGESSLTQQEYGVRKQYQIP